MRIAIDASNISGGGTATHLTSLLKVADPSIHGFHEIIIWAPQRTLDKLPTKPWLIKQSDNVLEGNYVRRAIWQRYRLGSLVRSTKCDLLFVPGGPFATDFRPVVSMSQNLLPFSLREIRRFGISLATLKFLLLRKIQTESFRKANGVIFLTEHAQATIEKVTNPLTGKIAIIPHGIDENFYCQPRIPKVSTEFSYEQPIRLVYVSTINYYKHQWCVAEAIAQLRDLGIFVSLDFIGSAYPPALKRLQKACTSFDPQNQFIRYLGAIDYNNLPIHYHTADICVFASTCENLPIALLEAMAAGLPVACSNRMPMLNIIGDAAVYFDPENPNSIAQAILQLVKSPHLRLSLAQRAFTKSKQYSWKHCADATFTFFADVVKRSYLP